jgi:hypothetical protein
MKVERVAQTEAFLVPHDNYVSNCFVANKGTYGNELREVAGSVAGFLWDSGILDLLGRQR